MAREMYPSNGRTPMVPGVINNALCTIFSPLSSILKMSFFVFSSDWRSDDMHLKDRRFFCSLSLLCPIGFLPFHLLTFFYFNSRCFKTIVQPESWVWLTSASCIIQVANPGLKAKSKATCRSLGLNSVDPLTEMEARHLLYFTLDGAAGDCDCDCVSRISCSQLSPNTAAWSLRIDCLVN
ncbi:hypothetical protein E4T47_01236 [Aureobasidium subglaciale]|nr:hypothetical protein E4T47_01236 [Aureobasidium subglaciale]